MLYSLDSPSCELHVSFGFRSTHKWIIRDLPDSTARLLRLKCVLACIAFMVIISAFEPD